jgi:hypothetical protein
MIPICARNERSNSVMGNLDYKASRRIHKKPNKKAQADKACAATFRRERLMR